MTNLAELINVEWTSSHDGMAFRPIQEYVYQMLLRAVNDKRTLLIPSNCLPRGCGKSLVLRKLSLDCHLYVFHGRETIRFNSQGEEIRVRNASMKGMRTVLIDEPTTLEVFEVNTDARCSLIGFSYQTEHINQSIKSEQEIQDLKEYIQQLQKRGALFDYVRTDQFREYQDLHDRELSHIFGFRGPDSESGEDS